MDDVSVTLALFQIEQIVRNNNNKKKKLITLSLFFVKVFPSPDRPTIILPRGSPEAMLCKPIDCGSRKPAGNHTLHGWKHIVGLMDSNSQAELS